MAIKRWRKKVSTSSKDKNSNNFKNDTKRDPKIRGSVWVRCAHTFHSSISLCKIKWNSMMTARQCYHASHLGWIRKLLQADSLRKVVTKSFRYDFHTFRDPQYFLILVESMDERRVKTSLDKTRVWKRKKSPLLDVSWAKKAPRLNDMEREIKIWVWGKSGQLWESNFFALPRHIERNLDKHFKTPFPCWGYAFKKKQKASKAAYEGPLFGLNQACDPLKTHLLFGAKQWQTWLAALSHPFPFSFPGVHCMKRSAKKSQS